ncbi:hypothetical protein DFJ77DRAFT_454269 [Powellomyces hirtus]|nr:hypothetical protein DFJ77DRAFT_454269 [Powellomyces hirtus]
MKATFYLNSNNYACIYDADKTQMVKNMLAAGHQIGSHTHSHQDISSLTPEQLKYQNRRFETAMMRIAGMTPRYFRAPFGAINAANIKQLSEAGYTITHWNVDSKDSMDGSNGAKSIENLKSDLARVTKGVLMLNHETKVDTAKMVVPWLIKNYKNTYKWVTVAECLGDKTNPYMIVPELPNVPSTCSASDVTGSLPV